MSKGLSLLLLGLVVVGNVWADNGQKDAAIGNEKPSAAPPFGNVSIPDPKAIKTGDPFTALHDRPMTENSVLVPQIIAGANAVPPQYLYELARRLWPTDRSSAMEWLAVGMVRARYDASRCVDASARQGIAFLDLIAPDVMTGIKQDRKAFSEAGRRALGRADLYADAVSPVWICSHGIKTISMALEGKKAAERDWLIPPADWASLKSGVGTEFARYLDEQGKLPNDPPPSNKEALAANLSAVTSLSGSMLDQAFAQHGTFKMSIESKRVYAKDTLVQPDGKIVVAVALSDKNYKESAALIRLKPDGTLDNQFGVDGIASAKVGATTRFGKIVLLPNGKIVVSGWAYASSEKNGTIIARYNTDGRLDESFADQGILFFPQGLESSVNAIAIGANEKILVGGSITIRKQHSNGAFVTSVPYENFFLAQIDKNGVLDTEFGEKGLVATDVGGGGQVLALTTQRDGRIAVAGTARRDATSSIVLAHYNQAGSLDKSFGNAGFVVREAQDKRYASSKIAMLPDGKLLVSYVAEKELLLTRFLPDGRPDLAFGDKGERRLFIGLLKNITAPLVANDGTITVSGMVVRSPTEGKVQPPYYYSFGLARFLSDGRGDSTIGPDGMRVIPIGAVSDTATTIVPRGNGRTILVGSSSDDQKDSHLVLLGVAP